MFEANEEIEEAAKVVYGLMAHLRRGDTLTHEAIGAAIGLPPDDTPPALCVERSRYDRIVWKARKRLQRDRGIACWFVEGVGYKLLTPAEQIESALWHTEKAMRSAHRGRKNVDDTPDKLLSPHLRRMKAFVGERTADARRQLLRTTRIVREQLRPTPTVPRRPLPPQPQPEARA